MSEPDTLLEEKRWLLEENRPLSQSLLWRLQRAYFDQQGINAWSQGDVPHYITSNPIVAGAYARVVFGFLRDCYKGLDPGQPLYILELGAGSGRFAYHFLQKFSVLLGRSALSHVSFQYVMTDFTQSNLSFYQAHPALRPFVERGVLDFAHFDAEATEAITLSLSAAVLGGGPGGPLKNPLIVLANYFFDSIPQDAFHVSGGRLRQSLVTLTSSQPEPNIDDPDLLNRIQATYENQPVTTGYYGDPDLDQILQTYQAQLVDTTFLFPHIAIACIRRLQRQSDRLLLLSGDKGYIHERSLQGRGKPGLNVHGSLSLMVNYHAIAQYVRNQGGHVFHTTYEYTNLNVCAFILGTSAGDFVETRQAYDEAVEQQGPDDFFSLKKAMEKAYETLTLPEILAYLRLTGWDTNIFWGCFSTLLAQVKSDPHSLRQEVRHAVDRLWHAYYHIGEARDLPYHLGVILYTIDQYEAALSCFHHSLDLYGPDANTYYNLALSYHALKQDEAALEAINLALELDDSFAIAQRFRAKLEAGRPDNTS